ncbi:transposase, partial [Sinorhizobium meliloti]|nr:transposase [Sinorhizobium meliloti]
MWLDVATYPVSDKQKVPNNADGWQTLADWLERQGIGRVGIEASGGYERDVIAYLHQRGFEVVLLQPRQVRAFGLYKLRRAKNDQLGAALIAECAARSDARCHAPDSRLIAFGEWLLFIEQIEADIACLKTRRERFTDRRILEEIDRSIGELKSRCKAQLALLQAAVREHDDLARKLDLIESIDGIGIRTALTLVILMPELGRVDREEIAALT